MAPHKVWRQFRLSAQLGAWHFPSVLGNLDRSTSCRTTPYPLLLLCLKSSALSAIRLSHSGRAANPSRLLGFLTHFKVLQLTEQNSLTPTYSYDLRFANKRLCKTTFSLGLLCQEPKVHFLVSLKRL